MGRKTIIILLVVLFVIVAIICCYNFKWSNSHYIKGTIEVTKDGEPVGGDGIDLIIFEDDSNKKLPVKVQKVNGKIKYKATTKDDTSYTVKIIVDTKTLGFAQAKDRIVICNIKNLQTGENAKKRINANLNFYKYHKDEYVVAQIESKQDKLLATNDIKKKQLI